MATAIENYVTGDIVTIDHLVKQTPSRRGSGAFLNFEGRSRPVGARSEHIHNVWSFEAVFARHAHPQAADVLDLLENAYNSADGRIVVHTTGGLDPRIDSRQVLEVHDWVPDREPGGVIRIKFEATEVDG